MHYRARLPPAPPSFVSSIVNTVNVTFTTVVISIIFAVCSIRPLPSDLYRLSKFCSTPNFFLPAGRGASAAFAFSLLTPPRLAPAIALQPPLMSARLRSQLDCVSAAV